MDNIDIEIKFDSTKLFDKNRMSDKMMLLI